MSFRSLVSAVSEKCQEIKEAMALFPYFEAWDANVVAECCRVSSTAEFPVNEIILGPDKGDAQSVHFLVKGICRMIHQLQVEVMTSGGKTIQKLRKKTDPGVAVAKAKDERYLSRLFNQKEGFVKAEDENPESGNSEVVCPKPEKPEEPPSEDDGKHILESDHHLKILEECKRRRADAICVLKAKPPSKKLKNVESLFIESGILLSGACFGFGKIGKENFVMSGTPVKVLKIPSRFLLEHNPCNIWNRISLFHSLYLFKEEKIFDYHQNERRWNEEKKKQTEEIVSLKKIPNYTCKGDVPYWIRLSTTR